MKNPVSSQAGLRRSSVVNNRPALSKAWLYPVRDLMGFCFWLRSYFGSRRLSYRGDPCELLPREECAS